MRTALRRLRAAFVNGILWGVGWGLAAVGLTMVLRIRPGPRLDSVVGAVVGAMTVGGLLGFVAGAAFSLALTLAFRNRSLQDVSVTSFTVAGAVVAALLLPGVFLLPALLSGTAGSAASVATALAVAGGLGGATAFGMIRLAKAAPDPAAVRGGDAEARRLSGSDGSPASA